MREEPRLRGLPAFGAAAAGLVLGHALAYLIAVPDPHQRAFVLQRAGHDYLPALRSGGADAGDRRGRRGRRSCVRSQAGWGDRALRPAGRPCSRRPASAFAGQEVLERLVSGAPLGDLSHDHILVIGMVVQVVVAFVGGGGPVAPRAGPRARLAAASRAASPHPGAHGARPRPSPRGGRTRSCSRPPAASERHPPPESPPRCSRARPSGRARTRLEVRPCRNDRTRLHASPPHPP